MAAAAVLFLMDLSEKLIRSSEIPREQPYQIWMQYKKQFMSYGAHKLGAKKNIWDELPRHIGHVCKK